MKLRSKWASAPLLVLVFMFSLVAVAQVTSRVTGVVKDSSGAVVPGAKVTLTNQGTNVALTSSTTSAGTYVFDGIQSGRYTISIEKEGFRAFQASDNALTIGQPLTVNATLQVGSTQEKVEVVGGAELVQTTTSGNFGTTIDNATLTQLPIVGVRGRNPLDLVFLTPGVVAGINILGTQSVLWC